MPRASLHDLFLEDLRDLYSAETQLLKALPRMAKAADAPAARHKAVVPAATRSEFSAARANEPPRPA